MCRDLSVAIVKEGHTVLAKGYGVRKLGEPTAVDENTVFGIGSSTKALTAAALATLVDEHEISWDDRVFERLPGFQMYDCRLILFWEEFSTKPVQLCW